MSVSQKSKDEIKAFLDLLRPEVAKELKIVTSESIKQDTLFHIAMHKQEVMFPFISKRAAPSEDNTVPRIHVAPTLTGCIEGFGGIEQIVANDKVMKKKSDAEDKEHAFQADYKGGFYIHELPFEVALKPSKNLVYDADQTGELWLVTYNKETGSYPSPIIGKIIPRSIEFFPIVGKQPKFIIHLVIEVTKDTTVKLSEKYSIGKGYWGVELDNNVFSSPRAISKDEFMNVKKVSATLLSYQEQPHYRSW